MSPLRRFFIAFALLVVLTMVGTMGYMRLEGWSFHEALYMTAITLSTVGFGEVRQLSPAGESFTVIFIFLSFTLVSFAVASITAFLVQGEIKNLLRGRRMQRQIEKLNNHYILCGCGAVGGEVVREFLKSQVPFVVVERASQEAELPLAREELFLVEGDATNEEVLEQAGIHRARGLISALHSDPENVFVTLTARQLNPKLQIVARASEKGTESKLLQAGADRVISPYAIAGRRMASTVLRPRVINFLDVVVHEGGTDMRLEEIPISTGSSLVDNSLRDFDLGRKTGAVVVGVHSTGGELRIAPAGEVSLAGLKLQLGDTLIVLGSEEQLNRLRQVVDKGKS